MQTEGERLRYYIENKEVNLRQFCIENDILYTTIHPILTGKSPLGMNVLRKIMSIYPNLNITWILTGKGTIEIDEDEIIDKIRNNENLSDPGYDAFLKYLERDKTLLQLEIIINKILLQNKKSK